LNQNLQKQILVRAKTSEAARVGFGAHSPLWAAWIADDFGAKSVFSSPARLTPAAGFIYISPI
jgi:hypothetical protein